MDDKKNDPGQSLFHIGSVLEYISDDMTRIQNLLQLFAENYEDVCTCIQEYGGKQGSYFSDRLNMLQSIWETIQILLEHSHTALEAQVAAVYAEHRKGT